MKLFERRTFFPLVASTFACMLLGGCFVEQHLPWSKPPELPAPITDATTVKAVHAETGFRLAADPELRFWKDALPVYAEKDRFGNVVPGYRTAIYTRWTDRNLYLLFVCPYETLHLRRYPHTGTKTWQLWKWDVAETFIGSDFDKIEAYKEFEMSPLGEWLDLDIDLTSPTRGEGMRWSSGFDVVARIDRGKKIWYGAMKIPFVAILPAGRVGAVAGDKLRINFFRSQGPPKKVQMITWQPPMSETFHVPVKFGTMLLVEKP
jgi:hypothetical protein